VISEPILWCRVRNDRRSPWKFWLSHEAITSDLRAKDGAVLMGYTDFERRAIVINANYPRRTWEGTATHELFHAVFEDTAVGDHRPLERFIEVAAVRGLPMLRQLGFRFPKPPRLPWRRKRVG
jgi:hypothetical protein